MLELHEFFCNKKKVSESLKLLHKVHILYFVYVIFLGNQIFL